MAKAAKPKIDEMIFQDGVDGALGALTVDLGEWITYKGRSQDVKDRIEELGDRWSDAYDEFMAILDEIEDLTGQKPSWR